MSLAYYRGCKPMVRRCVLMDVYGPFPPDKLCNVLDLSLGAKIPGTYVNPKGISYKGTVYIIPENAEWTVLSVDYDKRIAEVETVLYADPVSEYRGRDGQMHMWCNIFVPHIKGTVDIDQMVPVTHKCMYKERAKKYEGKDGYTVKGYY